MSTRASTRAREREKARIRSRKASRRRRTGPVTDDLWRRLLTAARRVPLAAWVCAGLAFVNAACWSLIVPPFQELDEPDHFAYVQNLAQNGSLPASSNDAYSLEEQTALTDLHQNQVRFLPANHPIFAAAQRQQLDADVNRTVGSRSGGGAGVAASEPPLYYALQTVPYALGSSGSILDRLQLMRLLSALMGAFTALFVFMFVREALPGEPWAWVVGGVGVALSPLFGFSTSSVNPDALLFLISAAVFYCLARGFRRGLTLHLALAIGALCALGSLTKLNFIGLAPGVLVALLVLVVREARELGASAYTRRLAPALGIAIAPGLLYALINRLSNHRTLGLVSSSAGQSTSGSRSLLSELSYIWQFYLPRLPGMHPYFGSVFTTWQIWFHNIIGRYGWADTSFPNWVYYVALIPVAIGAVLCVTALVRSRAALRARRLELACYALMTLGVVLITGAASYVSYPPLIGTFSDARYLLPMLALWGAILVIATRGAGRRWGPVVGMVLIVLVISHDLFAQLQVLARYYG